MNKIKKIGLIENLHLEEVLSKEGFINNASPEWRKGENKGITFIVTEECQLECGYCYFVKKNDKNQMDFEIAKKAIDYILTNRDVFFEESVVWDFIGGEPLLAIDTINSICDYIKMRTFELNHPWFDNYMINLSTNGLLYRNKKVQNFIKNNLHHLSIGITIDGTRSKHDLQRVYKNGKGSYNDVVKEIPYWLNQFPNASTKVTISSDDIPFISESVIHLFHLGIKTVNINVVFENVWKKDDEIKFESELIRLADAIIENKLYKTHQCSFFDSFIGNPVQNNQNWCGAGKMLAIDSRGNFYPCVRFTQFALQNKTPRIVGDINTGINKNKLRPFLALNLKSQSTEECIDCKISSGCAWCQAANYDFAETDTIYQRATYICKMHKARVRAKNYYFSKLNLVS